MGFSSCPQCFNPDTWYGITNICVQANRAGPTDSMVVPPILGPLIMTRCPRYGFSLGKAERGGIRGAFPTCHARRRKRKRGAIDRSHRQAYDRIFAFSRGVINSRPGSQSGTRQNKPFQPFIYCNSAFTLRTCASLGLGCTVYTELLLACTPILRTLLLE